MSGLQSRVSRSVVLRGSYRPSKIARLRSTAAGSLDQTHHCLITLASGNGPHTMDKLRDQLNRSLVAEVLKGLRQPRDLLVNGLDLRNSSP